MGISNSFNMKIYRNIFNKVISLENLFGAWEKFKKGKQKKPDVQKFEFQLEQNIFSLYEDLKSKKYRHGPYHGFCISDPKLRHIHKATVRDRVLHHAVFKILNPIFEPTFIPDSFSCRADKGNHKGVITVENMARKVSRNYKSNCYVLKCDIKKFFDSVDHEILLKIISKKIIDEDTMWLMKEIVHSFNMIPKRERVKERFLKQKKVFLLAI